MSRTLIDNVGEVGSGYTDSPSLAAYSSSDESSISDKSTKLDSISWLNPDTADA